MRNLILVLYLIAITGVLQAQKHKILIADFENKPSTTNWWKDNVQVQFGYDSSQMNQATKKSKTCLHVRWDSVPANRPYAWFTDLKADTFAVEGMQTKWKKFQNNTWISFWCKGGDGDTLMLHPLILSKGHKSKWGSTKMISVKAGVWQFVKLKFADLQYENWGVVKRELNLNDDAGKCFEVGLRLSGTSSKGFVEGWFDDIQLTNYEPFAADL
jgi:hypothetical protein